MCDVVNTGRQAISFPTSLINFVTSLTLFEESRNPERFWRSIFWTVFGERWPSAGMIIKYQSLLPAFKNQEVPNQWLNSSTLFSCFQRQQMAIFCPHVHGIQLGATSMFFGSMCQPMSSQEAVLKDFRISNQPTNISASDKSESNSLNKKTFTSTFLQLYHKN